MALCISLVLLSFLLAFPCFACALAQGPAGSARMEIQEAFAAVVSAEKEGGNVSSLMTELNQAIVLSEQASSINGSDPARAAQLDASAYSLAKQVALSAPSVAQEGIAARTLSFEIFLIEMALIAVLAILTYLYGFRVFWRLWRSAYSDWTVTTR